MEGRFESSELVGLEILDWLDLKAAPILEASRMDSERERELG